MWWLENLEVAIGPEANPENLNPDEVVPGPIWSLQMQIDIAFGPEDEKRKYYGHFIKNVDRF